MTVFRLMYVLVFTSTGFSNVLFNDINLTKNNEDAIHILLPRSTDVPCKNNNDCTISNTECFNGTCKCSLGFIIDGTLTKCLRVATGYNDECEESSQCSQFLSIGGICENRRCACKDGYHYLHGECHKTQGLNKLCTKNEDCFVHTEYQATSCVNGICKCSEGFYQREYETCRPAAKELEDSCIIDSDCSFIKNAICISQKCSFENNRIYNVSLDDNQVSNSNDEIELEISTIIGDSCVKQTDCKSLVNSHCDIDKKCICNRAHFWSNDSKACIPEIGENCDNSDEKNKVTYSICKDQVWTCSIDRVNLKNNQECRKILKSIGDSCQYREQCQLFGPEADCVDGQCACGSTTHWLEKESYCWMNSNIDQNCRDQNDCHSRGTGHRSFCNITGPNRGVCACPVGTHPSSDKGYCISDKPEFGAYCEKNEDCEIANSMCSKNKCKCRKNYFELEGFCHSGLNASCSIDTDCKTINSMCSQESICTCKENYVVSPKNECIPTSAYGQKCQYDIQCVSETSNTYCSFTTNPEKQSVRKITKDKYGHCECILDYFYNLNSCFEKKRLGEECTKEGECFAELSQSFCRNGKCTCDFDYIQEGNQCRQVNKTPTIHMYSTFVLPTVILMLKVL